MNTGHNVSEKHNEPNYFMHMGRPLQLALSNTVRTSTVVYNTVLLPGSITPFGLRFQFMLCFNNSDTCSEASIGRVLRSCSRVAPEELPSFHLSGQLDLAGPHCSKYTALQYRADVLSEGPPRQPAHASVLASEVCITAINSEYRAHAAARLQDAPSATSAEPSSARAS